jgi:hypothetical protein
MKNTHRGFAVPIIIAVVAVLVLGGGIYIYTSNNIKTTPVSPVPDIVNNVPTSTNIVGGDKDVHGCIGSAGYTWCAVKNKCLRVWEEKCEVTPINSGPGDKNGQSDVPPPLGNSTLRISCGTIDVPGSCRPYSDPSNPTLKEVCSLATKCNTEGVNSTRSDFYLIVDGTRIKVLIDLETRLRFIMGPNETLKKWTDFYPLIQPYSDGPGGMPFGATIYGDWIDATTFKANWIKWTIG